jgi:anti-sigma regulatory factor (Ser/Thr protein kinase)
VSTAPGVRLRFTANPAHVRTVRLVAVTMARRAGVDEGLLDEVRLAVGEACSRAVQLHRSAHLAAPVQVAIADTADRFTVTVSDGVPAGAEEPVPSTAAAELVITHEDGQPDAQPSALPPQVGLAVISGLVDEVSVTSGPQGAAVTMAWPRGEAARSGAGLLAGEPAPEQAS